MDTAFKLIALALLYFICVAQMTSCSQQQRAADALVTISIAGLPK